MIHWPTLVGFDGGDLVSMHLLPLVADMLSFHPNWIPYYSKKTALC